MDGSTRTGHAAIVTSALATPGTAGAAFDAFLANCTKYAKSKSPKAAFTAGWIASRSSRAQELGVMKARLELLVALVREGREIDAFDLAETIHEEMFT